MKPITETGTIIPSTSAYKFVKAPELQVTSNSETYAIFATTVASSVVNVFEVICGFSQEEQFANDSNAKNDIINKIMLNFILI